MAGRVSSTNDGPHERSGFSTVEVDGEMLGSNAEFFKWLFWYGLIALSVFLVFAYPVLQHNRKVNRERLERCVGARKASYEFKPSQDFDSNDLVKVNCPAPREVCTGAEYVRMIGAGRAQVSARAVCEGTQQSRCIGWRPSAIFP